MCRDRGPGRGRPGAGGRQLQQCRRSAANAAVEVFQRYKDAVVYLTGPMLGPAAAVEEFFALPRRRE